MTDRHPETEALVWALCAAAGGAGQGKCDPDYCACGGDARAAVVALHLAGYRIVKKDGPSPLGVAGFADADVSSATDK